MGRFVSRDEHFELLVRSTNEQPEEARLLLDQFAELAGLKDAEPLVRFVATCVRDWRQKGFRPEVARVAFRLAKPASKGRPTSDEVGHRNAEILAALWQELLDDVILPVAFESVAQRFGVGDATVKKVYESSPVETVVAALLLHTHREDRESVMARLKAVKRGRRRILSEKNRRIR